GTNDLGNPGPDYTYGFGMVNAKDSVDLIVADHGAHNRIRSITLADKQQFEMPVVVQSTQNLRVVLQWPDPPKFLPENQVSTAPATRLCAQRSRAAVSSPSSTCRRTRRARFRSEAKCRERRSR